MLGRQFILRQVPVVAFSVNAHAPARGLELFVRRETHQVAFDGRVRNWEVLLLVDHSVCLFEFAVNFVKPSQMCVAEKDLLLRLFNWLFFGAFLILVLVSGEYSLNII